VKDSTTDHSVIGEACSAKSAALSTEMAVERGLGLLVVVALPRLLKRSFQVHAEAGNDVAEGERGNPCDRPC
jgi:hypothetical protein